MNTLGPDMAFGISCATSAAEETQKRLPNTFVVKTFNSVFAKDQSTARVGNERLTAFIAGDDADAKKTVAKIAGDIGFDPVDCGP